MSGGPRIYPARFGTMLYLEKAVEGKGIPMQGLPVVSMLTLLRIPLPFGTLLLLGTLSEHRQRRSLRPR